MQVDFLTDLVRIVTPKARAVATLAPEEVDDDVEVIVSVETVTVPVRATTTFYGDTLPPGVTADFTSTQIIEVEVTETDDWVTVTSKYTQSRLP